MKPKSRIVSKPDKAIKEIEKINRSMNTATSVKVGLPKGSNDYPDGTSVIMVGAVHEFGSPRLNIPQRSFLRSTVQEQRRPYRAMFSKLAKKIVNGEIDLKKALSLLGLQAQTDVRQKIEDIKEPPLIYREGNPLIDTGHLRQSIVYQVEE